MEMFQIFGQRHSVTMEMSQIFSRRHFVTMENKLYLSHKFVTYCICLLTGNIIVNHYLFINSNTKIIIS